MHDYTRSAGRLAARIDCVPILCGPTTVFRVDAFKSRPFLNYRSFTTDWFASINHGANAQFVPGAPVGPVAVSVRHFYLPPLSHSHALTSHLEAFGRFTYFDSLLD